MNSLFLTVAGLSLACSAVILCVILLNKIFWKNYSRQWIYIIWAVIAIRLIIPVNIGIIDIPEVFNLTAGEKSFPLSDDSITNPNGLQAGGEAIKKMEQQPMDTAQKQQGDTVLSDTAKSQDIIIGKEAAAPGKLPFPLLNGLAAIWIAGAVLFLLYHLTAYVYFKRKISRWSIPVQKKEVLEQFDGLCNELGLKHKLKLVTSTQVSSPVLAGFAKPCIVLPSQEFTKEQYYFILKHELIHYCHHDLAYKFILLLANALHWFNPLIYYMVYLANNDIELYCDEKLVAQNNLVFRENYSKILLQIMTGAKKDTILLSTGFNGGNKQIKKRFFQIMNAKPSKKGICFIISLVCLIVLAGNLVSGLLPAKASTSKLSYVQTNGLDLTAASDPVKGIEKLSNILVVGLDDIGTENKEEDARADSVLVVSVNPSGKEIYLTSFLRDMYLDVPGHGKDKLSNVYTLGGTGLIQKTIEGNFGLTIDHTVTVKMKAFEKIIDTIGGVRIELSKEEAEYLNKTNYISNKKYRKVIPGEQRLNGNQALGYARVRKVPAMNGEGDDFGRTDRLRKILSSIIGECSKKKTSELLLVLNQIIPNVSTDLKLDELSRYLTAVLQENVQTKTLSIPAEGAYTPGRQEGMSVLEPDLEKNKAVLKEINP
ncbi:M56 family metallopeptidase [Anaerocolumna jejuensis]|uniref:M56 family metallopeptidase n=1 Tax=Anaerocolumna jejuensis TaxID=259063 RepID=UPI003F7BC302